MTATQVRERPLLLTLALIFFMHMVDFMLIMPLGPQLMRTLAITPQQFSVVVSSYIFSASILSFLAAAFIDRFDHKKALLFLYTGVIVGNFACGLAESYEFLVFARIVTGGFGGVISGLNLAIVSDVVPAQRRGGAIGVVMAAFPVASVLGVPIGLYLGTNWDWHMPFFVLGWLGLPVLALASYVLPDLKRQTVSEITKHPLHTLRDLFMSKENIRALMVFSIMGVSSFSVIPFMSPYMVTNSGIAEKDLFYTYLAGGVCTFLTTPLIGKLADRCGKFRVFVTMAVVSMVAIWVVTNLPHVSLVAAMAAMAFCMVSFSGRAVPAMALITTSIKPTQRSSFMTLNSSMQQLASGLAAYLAGLIVDKAPTGELLHYEVVGYFSIAMTVASIALAKRLKPIE